MMPILGPLRSYKYIFGQIRTSLFTIIHLDVISVNYSQWLFKLDSHYWNTVFLNEKSVNKINLNQPKLKQHSDPASMIYKYD